MRLSSVDIVTSDESDTVSFGVLDRSVSSRYLLRAIVGIDADEIVAKFYGFGAETAAKFYEFILPEREIVMRVAMNQDFSANETITEIRDRIYRLISANRSGLLSLRFNDGASTVCQISGSITKVEAPYFTQTPEVQITFDCPDPMFRSINPFDIDITGLNLSNKLTLIDHESTAPHGFTFTYRFYDPDPDFIIRDKEADPDWFFQVIPTGGFPTDSRLVLSSEYGRQEATLVPEVGLPVPIMDKVVAGSVWPQIFPGVNEFWIPNAVSHQWESIRYYATYWGL